VKEFEVPCIEIGEIDLEELTMYFGTEEELGESLMEDGMQAVFAIQGSSDVYVLFAKEDLDGRNN